MPMIIEAHGVYRITFKLCEWRWYMTRNYLETRFADGYYVPSAPDHARDTITAVDYGYTGDTWRLWRDHDLSHCTVMEKLGFDYSPTLRYVATMGREPVSDEFRWLEEGLVAEFQRYLNGGPVPTPPAGFARVPGELDWASMRREFLALVSTQEPRGS